MDTTRRSASKFWQKFCGVFERKWWRSIDWKAWSCIETSHVSTPTHLPRCYATFLLPAYFVYSLWSHFVSTNVDRDNFSEGRAFQVVVEKRVLEGNATVYQTGSLRRLYPCHSWNSFSFILVGLYYPCTFYVSLSNGFSISNGKRRKVHKEHSGELIERNRFLMQARWSSATSLWFLFSETWLHLHYILKPIYFPWTYNSVEETLLFRLRAPDKLLLKTTSEPDIAYFMNLWC